MDDPARGPRAMTSTDDLDRLVLSVAAARELDRRCIEQYDIPGMVLMENAGRGAAEWILRELAPGDTGVDFLCGPGNNGGDAFVAARHLHNAGVPVRLFATHAFESARGDARWARGVAQRMGLPCLSIAESGSAARAAAGWDATRILVDGLLGTGSTGAPRGAVAEALEAARGARPRLRVALDLPSGLDADSGRIPGPCFRADLTLAFAAWKPGLIAASQGPGAVAGRIEVVGIGAPIELLRALAGM
jgi:NAD(P)H-hydrate epimerase